jgi:phosphoribosyl 1,2-cyclic phosphodiesterase
MLARKYDLPVWITRGTQRVLRDSAMPRVEFFDSHTSFSIDGLQVRPFTVPHDAQEPCQFVFEYQSRRLGVLTDAGRMTPHIVECLHACDALLLECNHDADMLLAGPYSARLKQRVGGPLGHLSNAQAGHLLSTLDCSRLQHLVAAHLSDMNNRPELVQAELARVLDCEAGWIGVAGQEAGLGWRHIS